MCVIEYCVRCSKYTFTYVCVFVCVLQLGGNVTWGALCQALCNKLKRVLYFNMQLLKCCRLYKQ